MFHFIPMAFGASPIAQPPNSRPTMPSWTSCALFGPNRWSPNPTIEFKVDLDGTKLNAVPSVSISASLIQFLDSKKYTTTHSQSVDEGYRLAGELETNSSLELEWITLARWFSAMSGVPTCDFQSHVCNLSREPLRFECAMEMEEELLSHRCFELAEQMLFSATNDTPFDMTLKFRELFDYADDVRLGPSSRAILSESLRRGIPYYRLTSGSLVQLGEGTHQRRIWTAETDATSAIAESIASDKDLTKRLLQNVGVPVPLGRMVENAEDAWVAAKEVGFPVVVKPRDANHQRGISIELTQRDEILKAYEWAIHDGQTEDVIVEQFARGQHYRLLVVGDRMVAAARGHVETVTGDGNQTVEALVSQLNSDPRRGEAYTDPLGIVKLDAAAQIELSKQGLTIHSIPDLGQVVLIRRTGDLTTDCTEEVHPETAAQAVLAARVVGLDVAGLDVLALDIKLPLRQQRGAVVEVNAGPSLSPHVTPLFGKPQDVGKAIVEMLFPTGEQARIEIVGVLLKDLEKPKDPCSFMAGVFSRFKLKGSAIVFDHQLWVDGVRIESPFASSRQSCIAALTHPSVEQLIYVIEHDRVERFGFPVPRLDHIVIDGEFDASNESAGMKAIRFALGTGTRETYTR